MRTGLVPTLHPGQTVILDDLAAHKVAGVRAAIEAVGARLEYLPPYSRDFNPIGFSDKPSCGTRRRQSAKPLSSAQMLPRGGDMAPEAGWPTASEVLDILLGRRLVLLLRSKRAHSHAANP